jgi:hypothetical protein
MFSLAVHSESGCCEPWGRGQIQGQVLQFPVPLRPGMR